MNYEAKTPVRTDIVPHDLPPLTLAALREAMAHGLTPCELRILDAVVILRLTRQAST